MTRLIQTVAANGPRFLGEDMSRPIKTVDGLFEFKRGKLRVFWFYDQDRIVICSHGLVKKAQKTPKRDLERARATITRYREAKRRGAVDVEKRK